MSSWFDLRFHEMSVSINTVEVSDTEVYLHPMSVPYPPLLQEWELFKGKKQISGKMTVFCRYLVSIFWMNKWNCCQPGF